MTIYAQVQGCIEHPNGDIEPGISNQQATFFSVYLGAPMHWNVTDYPTREEALAAANKAINKGLAAVLDDRTFDEHHTVPLSGISGSLLDATVDAAIDDMSNQDLVSYVRTCLRSEYKLMLPEHFLKHIEDNFPYLLEG